LENETSQRSFGTTGVGEIAEFLSRQGRQALDTRHRSWECFCWDREREKERKREREKERKREREKERKREREKERQRDKGDFAFMANGFLLYDRRMLVRLLL
jgi:hypothetical protein